MIPPWLRFLLTIGAGTTIGISARYILRILPPHVLPSVLKALGVLNRIADLSLYAFLYCVIGGGILLVVVTFALIPLLDAVIDDPEKKTREPKPTRQPHDQESLVPENVEEQSKNRLGKILLGGLEDILAIGALIAAAAFFVRPKHSGILLGTYQVLEMVVRHTTLAVAAIVGSALVILAPLLIIFAIINRLNVEPHRTAWYNALKAFHKVYIGAFLYVLAIEALSSVLAFDPVSWQAAHLSILFRWIGYAAYSFGLLWALTDSAGAYLLLRGFVILSIKPQPLPKTPRSRTISKFAQLILLPIAMIYNGAIFAAQGATSTPTTIGWITLCTFTACLVDFALYWIYFFVHALLRRRSRAHAAADDPEKQYTTLDLLAASLVTMTVRNASGQTLLDQWNEAEVSKEEDVVEHPKAQASAQDAIQSKT
ncbi:hypothetical protein R3P38DRAFT_2853573 [Favolaschia claudopus]|uniref:Uncharacterized protein n=1 Tax=Favolaschia claudopus TaxID=2862362 RepID=A0AAW0DSM8_9AGAR